MPAEGPTQGAEQRGAQGGRWTSRPWLAKLLRFLIGIVPLVAAFGLSTAAARSFPPERVGLNRWVWLALVCVLTSLALLAMRKLARRAAPLAALMELTLVFPDQAPSRSKAILRQSSSRKMLRQIEEARERGEAGNEVVHGDYLVQLLKELNDHDRLTRGHSERVRSYSEMIGEELRLDPEQMNLLRWSALLHDVGKLEVPSEILNKDGRPTEDEWAVLSSHPAHGARMLEPLRGWLGEWIHAADQHHCRWDGGGYPHRLAGENIALAGRIVAVADAFDVMTSARSYKKPLPAEVARRELTECAGSQFDPAMVRAFLNVSLGRLSGVIGPFAGLLNGVTALQAKIPFAASVTSVGGSAGGALAAVAVVGTTWTPPVEVPDTLAMDDEVVVTALATNEVDVEGREDEALSFTLVADGGDGPVSFIIDAPAHGAIEVAGASRGPYPGTATDGGWSLVAGYVPDPEFSGEDSFGYQACDEATCSSSTVRLRVQAVNDPPLAVDDEGVVTPGGSVIVDVVANDTDIDSQQLTVIELTGPEHGSALVVANTAMYLSSEGHVGPDSLVYTIDDGDGGRASATLRIDVTAEPETPAQGSPTVEPTGPVANDDTVTVDEDMIILIDVLANDTTAANDTDTADDSFGADESTLEIVGVGVPDHGTAVIVDGRIRYRSDTNYNGTDRFAYAIVDGSGAPVAALVDVVVNPVNDGPTIIGPSTASVVENAAIGTAVATLSASDPENDQIVFSLIEGNEAGRFALTGDGELTVAGALDHETVSTYNLRLEATDGEFTDSHVVVVSVADGNESPVAGDDNGPGFSTAEDTPFTTGSVTANDDDVDDSVDPASIDVVAGPGNGSLTDNGDGTFDYVPDGDWSGTDSFTYTIADDGSLQSNAATVTIVVSPVNDAPTIVNPGSTVGAVSTPLSLQITGADIESHSLSFSAVGLPSGLSISGSGLISGTPGAGTQGSHGVDVTATDNGSPPRSATITVSIDLDFHLLSPEAGDITVNEVLYNSVSGTAPEEFVELHNGSGASANLSGWVLTDANLKVDGAEQLSYTLPSTDHWGTSSTLAAGDYAVIWVVYDGANLPPLINPASGLEYVVSVSGLKLGNSGDDIWLLDAETRIVDYMAYGSGAQVGTPPAASLGLWDATHQAGLATGASASVVLTPDGVERNDSACWEETASNDASGRCSGALTTIDSDSMAGLATSVGRDNNAAAADGGGPYAIAEGGSLVLDGSSSIGPSSWAWDLDNDGAYDDATGVNPTVPWSTLSSLGVGDDGVHTIGLQVDGGADTDTATVTITNVDPVLNPTGSATVSDGGVYTLTLGVTDPGHDTMTSWTINWGDGAIQTVAGNPGSVTHTYNGAGFTYNILASATDEDGTYLLNELLVPSFDGDDMFRYAADTGTFLQTFGSVNDPAAAIVGPDGNLYVSGEVSDNVVRYNAQTGGFIDEFVAAGSGGLNGAEGLAFGPDGHLYVGDWSGRRIRRYDGTTGAHLGTFATTGPNHPYNLVFGPDQNLYVNYYEDDEIERFNGSTGASLGTFVSAGSGGLDKPEQMAFGPDGHLYVSSLGTDQVLRYNGSTGAFIDVFIDSGGPGDLDEPSGLAFGPDGHLYVGDFADHAILRFNGSTGAFIDQYVTPGSGGLTKPSPMTFLPSHQVTVT